MKTSKGKTNFELTSPVRITLDAKEKLDIIAQQKKKNLSFIASNIIMHYVQNGHDYDQQNPVKIATIHNLIASMNVSISKMVGSTERTEDFIKSLLRDDNDITVKNEKNDREEETVFDKQPQEDNAKPLLGKLLAQASRSKNFDGTTCMVIKFSVTEFESLKAQYDQLCM